MSAKTLLEKLKRAKTGIGIVLLAGLLIQIVNAVQYVYARNGIEKEVEYRAKSELKVKRMEIEKILTEVETVARNMEWVLERGLAYPDSLHRLLTQIVEHNSSVVGCGIGFTADYYPGKGRWFEPYVARRSDGSLVSKQIGSESHDYLHADWFTQALSSDSGQWSEPYYDEVGAQTTLSTFSMPLHDPRTGRAVAVIAVDVSLDWLSQVLNAQHIYPSSYNVMLSQTGQIMACPEESLVMRSTIQEATARVEDTTAQYINRQMLAGDSGQAAIRAEDGEKYYVFYTPMKSGWSLAVVCADKEIYHGLNVMGWNMFALMIIGMALLAYILYRASRNMKRLQAVNAEKERIGSELRIASAIQMGMLPKIFPPYPDRNDVELYGSLVPAKEVGGDLYDFCIRDEKLFFCIGDVSGKGVPASLVMAVTRSLFRTVLAHEAMPNTIVSQMNDAMAEMNDANMFVTLFVGVLDLPSGRLRYCNAGHCPPMIVNGGRKLMEVDANIPVGLTVGWKYTTQETMLTTGNTVFLYTDGLTEAENTAHAQFGEQRMIEVAAQYKHPEELIKRMTEAVHLFVDGAEQSDDLTMLAIEYNKQQVDLLFDQTLTLTNDVAEVPRLAEFIEDVCGKVGFDAATTMQVNLAIEEAVVNVMNYAYAPGHTDEIQIAATASQQRLRLTISDHGIPFDPTAVGETDTSLSADERPIGGLGIHLVRQIMDNINYERVDGNNVLRLYKNI